MEITIKARPAEGKTTIALLIADALSHAGIDVTVEDPDVQDQGAALADPLLGMRAAALRAKDGFNVVVRTVQVTKREDLLFAQSQRLREYARVHKLVFKDKAALVKEWGVEEWDGVHCAVFAPSPSVSGDMLAVLTGEGVIGMRTRSAAADDAVDEDKFTDMLVSEVERAIRQRRKLHVD